MYQSKSMSVLLTNSSSALGLDCVDNQSLRKVRINTLLLQRLSV